MGVGEPRGSQKGNNIPDGRPEERNRQHIQPIDRVRARDVDLRSSLTPNSLACPAELGFGAEAGYD